MATNDRIEVNKIYNLDCREGLRRLKEQKTKVDCIVTSPPYWKQRVYEADDVAWDGKIGCAHLWNAEKMCDRCGAWLGQLGQEPIVDLFVKHLADIFDQAYGVLKNHGTLWIVIGDKFGERGMGMVPSRLAIEMCNRKWILPNDIIWKKPNCQPESVKSRFSVNYEHVLFFVKSPKPLFWANVKELVVTNQSPKGTNGVEGVDWVWVECRECNGSGKEPKGKRGLKYLEKDRETKDAPCKKCNGEGMKKQSLWKSFPYYFEQQFDPISQESIRDIQKRKNLASMTGEKGGKNLYRLKGRSRLDFYDFDLGKNKRSVWTIKTKYHTEKHLAIFPTTLAKMPIEAGCPLYFCVKCGLPKIKITGGYHRMTLGSVTKKGMYASCKCGAPFEKGVVLDPFMGIGNALIEAWNQQKNFIGFDLSKKYYEIATKRIKEKLSTKRIDAFFRK